MNQDVGGVCALVAYASASLGTHDQHRKIKPLVDISQKGINDSLLPIHRFLMSVGG